jgi:hypothetical protein
VHDKDLKEIPFYLNIWRRILYISCVRTATLETLLDVEEARWLLEMGADPDRKSRYRMSARDRVARRGATDGEAMRELFERYSKGGTGKELPMR